MSCRVPQESNRHVLTVPILRLPPCHCPASPWESPAGNSNLGGGTVDVTILEMSDGVFEVKSTGDMFIPVSWGLETETSYGR